LMASTDTASGTTSMNPVDDDAATISYLLWLWFAEAQTCAACAVCVCGVCDERVRRTCAAGWRGTVEAKEAAVWR
jgi:hypothetical protein